jgi:PhnB protein
MHAQLEAENGILLMAADTPNAMEFMPGTDINLSISGDNEDQLSSSYQKRRTVAMPLEKASGAIPSVCARIGLGVNRMVNITAPQA